MIGRPQSSTFVPYPTLSRSPRREWAAAIYGGVYARRNTSDALMPPNPNEFETTTSGAAARPDRKSTRLNSSHGYISYAVLCLKKKRDYKLLLHHESL